MTAHVRAIETEYRHYRFRSRTEARWAVFLDAAGIGWRYEFEGFNVHGNYYLPDFFLPELKTFLEVKPSDKEAIVRAGCLLLELRKATGNRSDRDRHPSGRAARSDPYVRSTDPRVCSDRHLAVQALRAATLR
jgi:hypothetical protein